MLTLYGDVLWQSPYVMSVFVTLREKDLDFEMKLVNLQKGEHRQQPYAASSLTAKVPALEHDGFWLSESLAIVEYLEERFPAPGHASVLPPSIEERARARQVMNWLRSGTERLRVDRPTSTIFVEPATTPLSDGARADADRLIQLSERLLPPGATTLFSQWSVCDTDLALMLHRLIASGDPVPAPIRSYAEAQWARPSVREYVEQKRPRS
jgi:glutathione S-transferase